jgi:hypothetical protein
MTDREDYTDNVMVYHHPGRSYTKKPASARLTPTEANVLKTVDGAGADGFRLDWVNDPLRYADQVRGWHKGARYSLVSLVARGTLRVYRQHQAGGTYAAGNYFEYRIARPTTEPAEPAPAETGALAEAAS